MIFTESTIKISNNSAKMDSTIVLYRGDKNIEIRFTILQSPFKYSNTVATNVIESTNASYGQLVIKTPNDKPPIFSEVSATKEGTILFTITKEMIDEIEEVGVYTFQIRLMDENKQSRVTIPPVENGIEIKEPIAIEDDNTTNVVGLAKANYAVATLSDVDTPAFDDTGKYNKTNWNDGDIITNVALNKIEDGIYTTNAQYKDIANKIENGHIGNNVEPQDSDIPKVFFSGDKPTSKTSVHATIEYKSKTEHFKGYVDIKCQGTSSMAYPKKNYTIKMFTDSTMSKKVKKDFKGWGAQSKFCLKANYIDHSHARNICSAKLWNQIVASRENYALLPELLRTSPCNGAIDGFPIKVYYNNNYEGIYTWNIPKDKWMFNMDDTLDNHCVLCGEEYNSGCFLSANARSWSDEIHDTMPTSIVTSFNAFQNFVINSTDDEFKANLENYVYVDSLIDYYIFQYVICGLDSMGKNQLFATYDGAKWIATSYDMDSTFGIYWNGQSFVSPTYRMQQDYESGKNGAANKLYVRLEKLFINEIKSRYSQLRADILSYNNIVNTFEPFMDIIGKDLYAEDLTIYTGIPSGSTNNIQQIRNYYRDRLVYVDAQIDKLIEAIPCTNIALNNTTLSFTTTDMQTLTATVTPTNTTDRIVWSVNPTGICTVENGTVTPTSNGQCTITATCGTKTATCNVTVNLPTVACTNIALNKNTLNLGTIETPTTENPIDLNSIGGSYTNSYFISNEITATKGIYRLEVLSDTKFTSVSLKINNTTICSLSAGQSFPLYVWANNLNIKIEGLASDSSLNEQFENVRLYKVDKEYSITETNLSFTYLQMGYLINGEITGSSQDILSDKVVLDSNKKYCIVSAKTYNGVCVASYLNNEFVRQYSGTTSTIQYLIQDSDSVQISMRDTDENAFNNWAIYELSPNDTEYLSEQLIATVEPSNTTDSIMWSVSPEGVATVDNGLVTAVSNGETVVTATCGTQSATCNVTVSNLSNIPTINYELSEPLVCDGTSTYKDTGIQLMSSSNIDRDWTMLLEFTTAQLPTNQYNVIVHCMKEQTPYPGINIDISNNNRRVITPNNKQIYFGPQVTIDTPVRYALVKQGKLFTVYNETGVNLGSVEPTEDIIPVDQTLLLGAFQTVDGVKGRFFNGTINKFKLVEEIYTVPQIRQYFGAIDKPIAYTLEQETAFNGTTDYIDTDIQLFKTDQNFTITIDATADTITSAQSCLIHCMKEESPYPGITLQSSGNDGYYALSAGSNVSVIRNLIPIGQRTKLVIVKNGTTMKAYTSNNIKGESVYRFASINQTLIIGAYQNTLGTKGRYFKGTIHAFSISNTVYTNEQINTYLGVNVATD